MLTFVDLTIDLTDLLKSFLVAFGPVFTVFFDDLDFLESVDSVESSESLLTYTNESSSATSLFWL